MAAHATPSSLSDAFFKDIENYSWSTDADFQSGLIAILGPGGAQQQPEESLLLRARCFYYSRKYDIGVDFDGYRTWRQQQPPESLTDPSPVERLEPNGDSSVESTPSKPTVAPPRAATPPPAAQPSYPASFADIVELIKADKPIPGVKDIPDTVLVGQGTEASQGRRTKPWERSDGQANTPGLFADTASP